MDQEAIDGLRTLVRKYCSIEDWQQNAKMTAAVIEICAEFIGPDGTVLAYADRCAAEAPMPGVLLCTEHRLCLIKFRGEGGFSWYESAKPSASAVGCSGSLAMDGFTYSNPSHVQCSVRYEPPVVSIRLPEELADIAGTTWWDWNVPSRSLQRRGEGHLEPYREWVKALCGSHAEEAQA